MLLSANLFNLSILYKMNKLLVSIVVFLSSFMQLYLFGQDQKSIVMQKTNREKIKAVYGFSSELSYFKDKSNSEIVSLLKEWNVNTIFGGYQDEDLVEQLHQSGIKVFAEVSFFSGQKWWRKYPNSRPITADGKRLEKEEWYAGVTPTDRDVFNNVLKRIDHIITSTAIDGIWLDFFRWPCHWESPQPNFYQTSFDDRTVDLFLKLKHISIPKNIINPLERNKWILKEKLDFWTDFKCDQIIQLSREVRNFVKAKNKNIIIGLFNIPWTDEDFDGALKKIIGQDLARLASYIDIFSPMVYHALCGQAEQWAEKITGYVYHKTGKPVLPIVQSVDIPRKITAIEFENVLKYSINVRGSNGIIIFNLKGINNDKLEKMIMIFGQN